MRKAHGASRKPIPARSGSSCPRRKTQDARLPGAEAPPIPPPLCRVHLANFNACRDFFAPEGSAARWFFWRSWACHPQSGPGFLHPLAGRRLPNGPLFAGNRVHRVRMGAGGSGGPSPMVPGQPVLRFERGQVRHPVRRGQADTLERSDAVSHPAPVDPVSAVPVAQGPGPPGPLSPASPVGPAEPLPLPSPSSPSSQCLVSCSMEGVQDCS